MKRMLYFVIFVALGMRCNAQVPGGIADVTVIDRDSGVALNPHLYHGEYWVAGRPGARYAIEIRNRLGERLLAVTSVDGVNVVSGATAAWDQAGYVFGPGERYQITGWRKTDAEVAAFTFTDSPNSYAERTGRPANVGVIGVAVFRERQPQPVYALPMIGQSSGQSAAPRANESAPALPSESMAKVPMARASNSAATVETKAQAQAQASPSMPPPASQVDALARQSYSMAPPSSSPAPISSPMLRAPTNMPKLGTGHGEREYSYVNHTEFLRMQPQPNLVIRIHYDSLDNLVAMGIVQRPRPAPPATNPFPASPEQQYVPDPPG